MVVYRYQRLHFQIDNCLCGVRWTFQKRPITIPSPRFTSQSAVQRDEIQGSSGNYRCNRKLEGQFSILNATKPDKCTPCIKHEYEYDDRKHLNWVSRTQLEHRHRKPDITSSPPRLPHPRVLARPFYRHPMIHMDSCSRVGTQRKSTPRTSTEILLTHSMLLYSRDHLSRYTAAARTMGQPHLSRGVHRPRELGYHSYRASEIRLEYFIGIALKSTDTSTSQQRGAIPQLLPRRFLARANASSS